MSTQAGDTPYEFAASLMEWMTDRAQEERWGGVVVSTVQDIRWLTNLYV